MRPLFYQYPRDKESYASEWENTEYFIGPDILVAPILEPGKFQRKVYLPQGIIHLFKLLDDILGEWFDFFTSKKYDGNQVVEISAKLDELPVFVRSGSVIPVR